MEKSYEQQMAWLSLAESRAQNPEFKELWKNKRKELVELLQSGNSYDEHGNLL